MSHERGERDPAGESLGVDPFFTARVLAMLPERPLGASLQPRRRLAVLLVAYALAAVVALAVVGSFDSAAIAGVRAALGGWTDGAEGTWLVAVVLPMTLLAVAIFARKNHTEAA
ncbi:MAG: hypothetical protein K1X88_18355 [Nannocystaceae bacterium]|nr:hypothetical protein [Nannocystaceae bacterium]